MEITHLFFNALLDHLALTEILCTLKCLTFHLLTGESDFIFFFFIFSLIFLFNGILNLVGDTDLTNYYYPLFGYDFGDKKVYDIIISYRLLNTRGFLNLLNRWLLISFSYKDFTLYAFYLCEIIDSLGSI